MAATNLTVELRTPEGSAFSGDAAKITRLPGASGPMGVLSRHAPLMSSLSVGLTSVIDAAGTRWDFVTGEGFVEILDDHVLILVDTAEDVSEVDVDRAKKAMGRARERLSKPSADMDRVRAEAALDRAMTRLQYARVGA